jgi:hypothetical protein
MKLPNASLAKVERAKITEYLLNAEHRYGPAKPGFLLDSDLLWLLGRR